MIGHDPMDEQVDEDLPTEDCEPITYRKSAVIELEADCGNALQDYVHRRLGDDPGWVEVVERCWHDLIRKWHYKGELVRPRALLFRLAQYRVIDRKRQTARYPEIPHADDRVLDDIAAALRTSPEFVSAVVVHLDVGAALAELPIRQQNALLYAYGYGLTYEDTANLMACTAHTVGNLLRAGKANLKNSRYLTGYGVSSPSPPEVNR